jgi:hypothetical protein
MRFHRFFPLAFIFSIPTFALGCGGGSTDASGEGDTGGEGFDTGSGGDDTGGPGDSSTTDSGHTDACCGGDTGSDATPASSIQNVFVIMEENHSWSDIKGSSSAPFINGTLLPMASHAEQYFTPPGNHPSEPNYIWLEAGDNLGITADGDPGSDHRSTTSHLVSQLEAAGISWKAYVEDIDGTTCPLSDSGLFVTRHTPMLFFDDVTDTNSATSAHCIAHIRPFTELATDLAAGKTARFNFITPNLCHDMHGQAFGTTCETLFSDLVKGGDDWLSSNVPPILSSSAYKSGALFILWDEGSGTFSASDGPIGAIVLSPFAKGGGYPGSIKYDHSSSLATWETIFGVPKIRGAASATDLRDLFKTFP